MLDPSLKARILRIDAKEQMKDNLRQQLMQSGGMHSIAALQLLQNPYLKLVVERDNLIQTTLQQMHGMSPTDFKKPMKVKFRGEDGVDEGGVRKEFFMLIIRDLFQPGYDMFAADNENGFFWFNKDSMTSNVEFELIGRIMGLAIFNSIILDVRFPRIVYKKLLGVPLSFDDLAELNPGLHKGFIQMLEYEEKPGSASLEDVFCRSFSVEYEVFGGQKVVELKPGGADIPLTIDNREEYVRLYLEWYFNRSIHRQFVAFARGFHAVCGGDILNALLPEEVELLVCGSTELDFSALEQNTKYDGGFHANSTTVRHFWEVVHDMTEEEKRLLLTFSTGSDRVPINGLGEMGFILARHGPDSDRLPSAHTCFNVLLLPDYRNKEKLERLLKAAIQNSEGFGML